MKQLLLFTTLILLTIFGKSQSVETPTKAKHYRMLYYYTYGMPSFFGSFCELDISEKYHFDFKMKAGCVVSERIVRRCDRHNVRVDRKMIERYGPNWREQYEAELKKCKESRSYK